TANEQVNIWLTTGNQSQKLSQQSSVNFASDGGGGANIITINESNTYQTMDGFGYTFTEGSAQLIRSLNASQQDVLMNDIFNPTTGIANSMIRIGIGATDLSSYAYSYNNTSGDVNMNNFSLAGPDLD